MAAALASVALDLTITIAHDGNILGTVETTGNLPVTLSNVTSADGVPHMQIGIEDGITRSVLAEALRNAADQLTKEN